MRIFTIMFFIMVVTFSCGKSNSGPEYPSKYISETWRGGPIRLFVNSGEIKDNSTIINFVGRHASEFVLFGSAPVTANLSDPSLEFIKPDSGVFKELSATPCRIESSGDDQFFISRDTLGSTYNPSAFADELYKSRLRKAFSTRQPFEELVQITSPALTIVSRRWKQVYYARRMKNKYELSIIYHTVINTRPIYFSEWFSNKLKVDEPAAVRVGDTLVIQEKLYTLRKI